MMDDGFDLNRFVVAQNPIFEVARGELANGRKQSHWIWFIFPQLRGLGRSPMAERYGISCRAEAEEYILHPVLGPRLIQCTDLVNGYPERSAEDIFGFPDDLKFRSCMTLFAQVAPENASFRTALKQFFAGFPDPLTLDFLSRSH
jgi:uncharacterized protein (DUF1810 family)